MKKWLAVAAIIVAVFVLSFGAWKWFEHRQARVVEGLAHPTFPYSDYTIAELENLYPQYIKNDAPTVQSPEETHRKFLAAVKKGDFDEAVNCCFREGDRVEMKKRLEEVKNSGKINLMLLDLQTIKLEMMNESTASYSYLASYKGEKIGNLLTFIKDRGGIWHLEKF